jgi:hypothetical protein
MESERGIIIIGHCRAGKDAMIRQALKGRCVLIGPDLGDIASAVTSLNMSLNNVAISAKRLADVMVEFQSVTLDMIPSFRDNYFRYEALKLRSFQEDLNTIVYEKVQNKFISRPRNNFRKR